MAWIIIFGTLVLIFIWLITSYNRLIHLRNVRHNAFANIDVILRQRYDLVPQLVATVKGYAAHERLVLENVIKARSAGLNSITENDKIRASENMHNALLKLMAVAENYPNLKADTNFLHLQASLCEVEEQLVNVRSFFNMATREYNDQVQSFPGCVVANSFGFKVESMLSEKDSMRNELLKYPEIKF